MKTYTVTITQTETRTYTLKAATKEEAIEQAEAWNEDRSGDCPPGCDSYDYSFDSETKAVLFLVKGYMTWRRADANTIIERHYAVWPDGRVMATEVLAPTVNFGKRSDGFQAAWVPATLPDNVEYIGTYLPPNC